MLAHQIHGREEFAAIDANLDQVAIMNFSDGAAGERFRRDVANAWAGGDAAEAAVGEERHVAAMR